MKIYVDATRPAPEGWKLVRWPENIGSYLAFSNVKEISLDYHLVDGNYAGGLEILLSIEKAVIIDRYVPPKITVHTTNEKARRAMEAVVKRIQLHHLRNSK